MQHSCSLLTETTARYEAARLDHFKRFGGVTTVGTKEITAASVPSDQAGVTDHGHLHAYHQKQYAFAYQDACLARRMGGVVPPVIKAWAKQHVRAGDAVGRC